MAEPEYTLYADQPFYKRVPWWAWLLGLGLVVVVIRSRGRSRAPEFEDYLR